MGGWFADVLIEWLVRMIVKFVRRIKSLSWPVVMATVTTARYERAGYGCDTTDLHFDYSYQGHEFSGMHTEPFLLGGLGRDYANQYPSGAKINVRVKPANPEVTVALAD